MPYCPTQTEAELDPGWQREGGMKRLEANLGHAMFANIWLGFNLRREPDVHDLSNHHWFVHAKLFSDPKGVSLHIAHIDGKNNYSHQ